jgi:hypothetical protein
MDDGKSQGGRFKDSVFLPCSVNAPTQKDTGSVNYEISFFMIQSVVAEAISTSVESSSLPVAECMTTASL